MKTIAVIPARLASTRLPAKLLQDLCGKPVILRTFEAALHSNLFDEVIVATDSEEIFTILKKHQANVVMSKKEHESGSDRIAEVAKDLDADIIINIQGDEPFIDKKSLKKIIENFKHDTQQKIDVITLKCLLTDDESIANPNHVKVVTDNQNFALYFSRAFIPFPRDGKSTIPYWKHIGVYGFRRNALLQFTTMQPSPLELTEKLEQLRYLENGKRILLIETDNVTIGIDTQEDLEKARLYFTNQSLSK
jgi:3-deoxy-manno-octulosonate cytidylyltransferase (CMP-KDO synthetase)